MVFKKGDAPNPTGLSKFHRRMYRKFYIDMKKVWEESGIDALRRVAKDDPGTFIKVAAGMMPKNIHLLDDTGKQEKININVLLGELNNIINVVGMDKIKQLPHEREVVEESVENAEIVISDGSRQQ